MANLGHCLWFHVRHSQRSHLGIFYKEASGRFKFSIFIQLCDLPNLTETFWKLAFSQHLTCFPGATIFTQTCFGILHYIELKYISTTGISVSTTQAYYSCGHLTATQGRSMCAHGRVSYRHQWDTGSRQTVSEREGGGGEPRKERTWVS